MKSLHNKNFSLVTFTRTLQKNFLAKWGLSQPLLTLFQASRHLATKVNSDNDSYNKQETLDLTLPDFELNNELKNIQENDDQEFLERGETDEFEDTRKSLAILNKKREQASKLAIYYNPYDDYKIWYYKKYGKHLTYEEYLKGFSPDESNDRFVEYKQLKKTFKKTGNWVNYLYENKGKTLLTDNLINLAVNSFWNTVILEDGGLRYGLIFKILFGDGRVRNITKLIITSNSIEDKQQVKEIIMTFWALKPKQEYTLKNIDKIIFTYKTLDNTIKTNFIYPEKNIVRNNFTFNGINLPNTADLTLWEGGLVRFNDDYNTGSIIFKQGKRNIQYFIDIKEKYYKVDVFNSQKQEKPLFTFCDYIDNPNDLSTFKRYVDNTEYIFEQGEMISNSKEKKVDFMKKSTPSLYRSSSFITMDLETRTINEQMEPVCLSIYDGKEKYSYFISDYLNSEEMVKAGIKSVMKRKYYGWKVYFHNFSYFDGVFILRLLSEIGKIKRPLIRENRLIQIPLNFDKTGKLYFQDSYLLLPESLDQLAKSFNVENKGIFPIFFLNEKNLDLNYKGEVPDFKFFPKGKYKNYLQHKLLVELKYNEYLSYKSKYNKDWELKQELIRYCEQDVITLHQVIDKFSKEIFNLFRVDITKSPTLSSLAFTIYRTRYMSSEKIPLINGEIYNDIRCAYTGGYVDVFKPFGENVDSYDVVSLYPSSMRNYPMPVGNPKYIQGKDLDLNNLFGFFYVKVDAPLSLNVPLLQHKLNFSTVTPVGTWSGWYFSEELKNAVKHGYKIRVLKGWSFEKEYIFTEYINYLFNLKQMTPKQDPKYIIFKLLLNGLYGRFGMSPYADDHAIINKQDEHKYLKNDKYQINNILDLNNNYEVISFNILKNIDYNKSLNISIPIAAAITSYSRIKMSDYLLKYKDNILTIDTDGIKTNCPLDPHDLGHNLGDMNYEYSFKQFVSIAPKVYGGVLKEEFYNELVKVKGLKNPISFNELKSLLYKNNKLEINQDKWYRHIDQGYINIVKEIYTLMATDNKRELIYDSTGKFIDTKPLVLNDGVKVDTEIRDLFLFNFKDFILVNYIKPMSRRALTHKLNQVEYNLHCIKAILYKASLALIPYNPACLALISHNTSNIDLKLGKKLWKFKKHKNTPQPVIVLNKNQKVISECSSLKETARKYNIQDTTLKWYINKMRLFNYKFYFISKYHTFVYSKLYNKNIIQKRYPSLYLNRIQNKLLIKKGLNLLFKIFQKQILRENWQRSECQFIENKKLLN